MIGRQLSTFVLVGCITVLIDFLVYQSLLLSNTLTVEIAKGGGFVIGTCFAYFANRAWTFRTEQSSRFSLWKFLILYPVTLVINVTINSATLTILAESLIEIYVAFGLATMVSASLNFVGMKYVVFRPLKLE
jgi:putative flippase GtrA